MSLVEATSYVALLVATLVKAAGVTDVGVTVLGPVHGVLYLCFVALIAYRRRPLQWPWPKAFTAMIIGSLPLGGYWLERKWFAPMLTSSRTATTTQPATNG